MVVAFITAAMICVLSIFNGIENLVQELFANFDAQLTVVPREGKMFSDTLLTDSEISAIDGVAHFSRVIEEDAWLNHVVSDSKGADSERNTVATIKGIDTTYTNYSAIASMIYDGRFVLEEDSFFYAVPGLAVAGELGLSYASGETPILNINAPIRGRKLSRYKEAAFNHESIMVSGMFSVNAELDSKYVFVPLKFAREVFGMDSLITSIEIILRDEGDEKEVIAQLQKILPPQLELQTRFDKNALVYQTNQSEKWATFLILLFILLIACFNISASLTMLIIEKKNDIGTLTGMGAGENAIRKIFVLEGVMINFMGAIAGTLLGLLLCLAQQHLGLIRMEGAMVEFYPVLIRWVDVLGILATVILVGSLFSVTLVRSLMKRFVFSREKAE